jgi:hypothetical protein
VWDRQQQTPAEEEDGIGCQEDEDARFAQLQYKNHRASQQQEQRRISQRQQEGSPPPKTQARPARDQERTPDQKAERSIDKVAHALVGSSECGVAR